MTASEGVHLVGSMPLADAETVFRTAAAVLGDRLLRLPDGETGARTNWIEWQVEVFNAHPDLVALPPDPASPRPVRQFVPRAATDVAALEFGPLGYAAAARASWEPFERLQADGTIPAHVRFQVCLPTPLAPVALMVAPAARESVERAYERAMLRELAEIVAAIPRDRLSIQWDTAVEFAMLEGVIPSWIGALEQGIVERLLRLGEAVPDAVPVGYHLCYGDAAHRHFVEPGDAGKLVTVANAIARGLTRPPAWIHLPVPRARDDAGYFRPLADLALPSGTELYLGLLHATDGEAGAARRIAAARAFVPRFGVATECGFGRRDPATIPDLLALHAAMSTGLSPSVT